MCIRDRINKLLASGLSFVADRNARVGSLDSGAGPCHSRGSLWDNGADPVAELNRLMQLRRVVLDNFSEAVIKEGQPLAKIEDALVPAYLMHRYQVAAAATVLGGKNFTYALKGDGQIPTTVTEAQRQRAALDALLATLDPEALSISAELVALIPPRPPMSGASRELFPRQTGYVFDSVAAAATAAELTLRTLLDPSRAARLIQQNSVDPDLQDFSEVLMGLVKAVGPTAADTSFTSGHAQLARRMQKELAAQLMALASRMTAADSVRGAAAYALHTMLERLTTSQGTKKMKKGEADGCLPHYYFLEQKIRLFEAQAEPWQAGSLTTPPGSPI